MRKLNCMGFFGRCANQRMRKKICDKGDKLWTT